MTVIVAERLITLCGETQHAGRPCALIRCAGCDLDCAWCDTLPARDPSAGREQTLEELVAWSGSTGLRLVLLTGGEPLLQPRVPELARQLCAAGHEVLVETSGAHDISVLPAPVMRSVDVKCPGSGQVERNLWDNLDRLRPGDAVKMVLADRQDYEFARQVIARHELGTPVNILLSCAYPQLEADTVAHWMIQDRLDARLNMQLHRILWPAPGGPYG